ncbi:MAG: hypothetical protein E6R10_10000 [Rhodocyclaceae bacterium]|nr:MAG: hypothetical protein E6R10_10000 [Rhodocyclaceae bacterium]
MEITVYLANGQSHAFSQPDQNVARMVLADLMPGRLFGSSSIIFGSGANCTLLKTTSVSRIDVLTDEPVSIAPTIRDSARVIESNDEFSLRAKAAVKALGDGVAPGQAYQGYLRFELTGGHSLLVELERVLAQQAQFFTNLHRLVEGPAIMFPHPRGGAIFLNVTNIVSVTASPGFAEYPKGTVLAEPR